MWKYNPQTGETDWYTTQSSNRLSTIQDMIDDGWKKCEAQRSLKAIQKLLKNPKMIVTSETDINIFEYLIFPNKVGNTINFS